MSVQSVPMVVECASPRDYWQMFVDHAGGVLSKVSQLREADRDTLIAAVEAGASQHVEDGPREIACDDALRGRAEINSSAVSSMSV